MPLPQVVRRRLLSALALALCFLGAALAKSVCAAPEMTLPPASDDSATYAHFSALSGTGDWDQIISDASDYLAQKPPVSANVQCVLSYFRGKAYGQTGRLDEAEADLQSIVKDRPGITANLPVTALWDTVERQRAARPKIERDVTVDGQIRIKIFADADDIVLKQVVALAPATAAAAESLLGKPLAFTTILIFADEDHQRTYNNIAHPRSSASAPAHILGDASGVQICVPVQKTSYDLDPETSWFHFPVAREYMRANVARALANRLDFPLWLREGIADYVGVRVARGLGESRISQFQTMVHRNEIKTLDDLTYNAFNPTTQSHETAVLNSLAYAQTLDMTSLLLQGRKESIFGDLLQKLRQTDDFDATFKATFGESVPEFYDRWHSDALTREKSATFPTATDLASAMSDAQTFTSDPAYDAKSPHDEWDQMIAFSTAQLAKKPPLDTRTQLLYHFYRGDAYWHLGLFEDALTDLEIFRDGWHDPGAGLAMALDKIGFIQRQIAARPKYHEDVVVDGAVRLTIFGPQNDPAFRQVVELAPIAVNAVKSVIGELPPLSVINVFESDSALQTFIDIPYATWPFTAGILATGGKNGIDIRLIATAKGYSSDPFSNYFRHTVAHEYTHVLVGRMLEGHIDLPAWLSEGIAEVVGGHAAPIELASFADKFQRVLAHHNVMTLDALTGSAFLETAIGRNAVANSFPYAQAANMTTFLLLGRKHGIFLDLLHSIQKTNNFNTSFQEVFGETVPEFYADWRAYAAPIAVPKEQP